MLLDLGRALSAGWRRFRSDRRRQVRLAYALWLVLGLVVWNVVFDRVLVLAGRRYVYEAYGAWRARQEPVLVEPWMREARARAVRNATLVSAPLALAGLAAVAWASRREAGRTPARPSRSGT